MSARRKALKTTAFADAGFTIIHSTHCSAGAPSNRVNIAVIGSGWLTCSTFYFDNPGELTWHADVTQLALYGPPPNIENSECTL